MISNSSFYEKYQEPIYNAKFIVTNPRVYSFDFEQNIAMEDLKLMIHKASHLFQNKFRIFSNGIEFISYNSEIIDSLFLNQKLVVFTL